MSFMLLALIGARNFGLLIFKFKSVVHEGENWMDTLMFFLTLGTLITCHLDIVTSTHIGSLSILILWFRITFLIGRFPTFGIYIYMSNYIFFTLVMFFSLYMSTIFGKAEPGIRKCNNLSG